MCLMSIQAQSTNRSLTTIERTGKDLFESKIRFENGGPSCISCHSVDSREVTMGGLFAKNLTDVYSRLGEGITPWLSAPPFPAMAISYQNNPLTESERIKLQAFLKYINENNDVKTAENGYDFMLIGGGGGLVIILILINSIWLIRKRKMVKQEIFDRQIKALDAKF